MTWTEGRKQSFYYFVYTIECFLPTIKNKLQNVEVHDREDLSNGVHSNVGSGRHDSVSSTSSLVSSGVSLVGGNSVTAPAISGLLSSSTNDGDFSHTFELKEAKESIIFKVREYCMSRNSEVLCNIMI